MKSIQFILSILIFSMSIVPCSDSHAAELCGSENLVQLVNHSDTEDHDGHSHDAHDHCTPFCVCACCGLTMQLTNPSPLSIKLEPQIFSDIYLYSFSYKHTYCSSIWQPPSLN